MRFARSFCGYGLAVAAITMSCGGGNSGSPDGGTANEDGASHSGAAGDASSAAETAADSAVTEASAPSGKDAAAHDAHSGAPQGDAALEAEADAPIVIGPGSDSCMMATSFPLTSPQHRVDLPASVGAAHSIAAPCATDNGPEVFYSLAFSKPVIVYADTFGSSADTVLYLLNSACAPLTTPTLTGGAACNDDACGTQQSQIVTQLDPGRYKLAVSLRGTSATPITVHFAWGLAPSGSETQLPQGSNVLQGMTSGASGNIESLSTSCVAAGPENGYWWTSCPADPGGMLSASTCQGTTWESVIDLEIPGTSGYLCNVDGCGLQSQLSTTIPAGAGLRLLSVDGQTAIDSGNYTLTVTRP